MRKALEEKRKAGGLREEKEEQPQHLVKKAKHDDDRSLQQQINDLTVKALWQWNEQMQESTKGIYQSLYGQHWEEGKKFEMEKLAKVQADEKKRQAELAKNKCKRSAWETAKASCSGTGIYRDDWDPRF